LVDKFKVGSSRCDDRTAQRAIPTNWITEEYSKRCVDTPNQNNANFGFVSQLDKYGNELTTNSISNINARVPIGEALFNLIKSLVGGNQTIGSVRNVLMKKLQWLCRWQEKRCTTARAFFAVISMVVVFQFAFTARAAERQVVHVFIPAATAQLHPVEPLAGSQHLQLAIGLPWRTKKR
jgi:hypothetical protein